MTSPHLWWWWWGILRWNSSPGTNTGRSDSPRFSSGSPIRHGHTLNYWLPQPWVIPSDSSVTATRRCGGCPHLAVPHSLVMVAVGDQHVEQGALQTCFRLEEDVVRKGPMNVWPKKKDRHTANARRGWWLTCSSNHLSFRRRSWVALSPGVTASPAWMVSVSGAWCCAASRAW